MQLFYNSTEKHQIFLSRHLPNLAKMGIGLYSLPELEVYIDKQYPNFYLFDGQSYPHVLRRDGLKMWFPLMTWTEAQTMGWSKGFFNRIQQANLATGTVEHEFGHAIHFTYFGSDGSDIWQNVWRLMGKSGPADFSRGNFGKQSGEILAYELFANYFSDMCNNKITNPAMGQYLCEIMGTNVLTFTQDSGVYYSNHVQKKMDSPLPTINGRTYLPVRTVVEELKGKTLQDVIYNQATREVMVLA